MSLVATSPARAAVVGLWRFNESSGNAADGSGNGNTASPVGAFASYSAGKPGFGNAATLAIDLAATPQRSYFQVPGDYSLQVGLNAGDPWSFAAWAKQNSDGFGLYYTTYGIVMTQKAADESNFGALLQGGAGGDDQYYFTSGSNAAFNGNNAGQTGVSVPLDTWTHVAVVYNGADLILYKNGVEGVRKTVGSQSLNFFGYDGALQIGGGENRPPSRNWDGQLDDVAVFNQALTPAQLSTVMAGDFSSFISPLPPPTSATWQTSGFGKWTSLINWSPVLIPNSNAITAVFGGQTTSATTVVADQTQTVKSIQFNHTLPYAIAGAGSIVVGPASGNGSISVLNAGGSVTHEFQAPVQLAANVDVTAAAGTTLEFDQQLRLNGKTMNVSGAGRVNVNNDGTSGTPGTVSNTGTLGGAGTILGALTNLAGGKLAVDLSGTGTYGMQGLTVTGSATLAGMLQISLLNGFVPANGNTFDVLTAGSIVNNGITLGGASAGFSLSIVGGTKLRLTYGAGLAGDYDGNGLVDGGDFLVWQRTLGSTTNLAADGNGNLVIDAGDLTIWKNNFGTPVAASTASVPEPATALLLALLGIVPAWSRQKRSARATRSLENRAQAAPARTAETRRPAALAAAAAAALLLGGLQTARATVLTFDFDATSNNFPNPPDPSEYTSFTSSYSIVPEYGDRVSGPLQSAVPTTVFGDPPYWYNFRYGNNGEGYTPNVVVNYVHPDPGNTIAFRSWIPDYGGLEKIAYPSSSQATPKTFYMTFKGDAGVNVTLSSLQVDRYKQTGNANLTVKVYQGIDVANLGPQLYTSGSLLVTQGTPTTVSPNVSGNALTLALGMENGGVAFNWGFDNVVFSQSAGVFPTSVAWNLNGSGRWTAPLNWTPDYSPTLIANGNDRTAVFGNVTTAPSTVVLDADITIKKIQLNHTQPYNLAGTGKLTLEANTGDAMIEVLSAGGATTHQITAPVALGSNAAVTLAAGTTLEINNKLTLGSRNLVKTGGGTLSINNLVESSGGSVSAVAGLMSGGGVIGGNLTNEGATVAPGNSPGKLTVLGDYSQTNGSLAIELGGPQQGTEYDVLGVAGALAVTGGILDVRTIDDFRPAPGDVFDILDFGSASGRFDAIKLPAGVRWDVSQLFVDGTIVATAVVPEPGTALAAAAAAALLGWSRRKRRA